VLTLLVLPVLHAASYRVREPTPDRAAGSAPMRESAMRPVPQAG